MSLRVPRDQLQAVRESAVPGSLKSLLKPRVAQVEADASDGAVCLKQSG